MDHDNTFDLSEQDQLTHLEKQIGATKKKSHQNVKKAVKVLDQFLWRKQMTYLFSAFFSLRDQKTAKIAENKIKELKAQLSKATLRSEISAKDDSTSAGITLNDHK